MARDQIEESLRNKVASIKVHKFLFQCVRLLANIDKSIYLFMFPALKIEGTHGSATRCSKRSRSHF